MNLIQKKALLAGILFFALLLTLVSAGCSQRGEGSSAPVVTPSAAPSPQPGDLDGIVARYRASYPSPDNGTGPEPEPCGTYVKTGEFVEAVGGLFDLIREDAAVGRVLSDGGEIAGVVVVCPPSAAAEPEGPGCYPAVRVRYGEVTIDYLVNVDCMRIERTSVEVPAGYLTHTVDNVTYVVHDGDVVLALEGIALPASG
ncbi:MULTISPECIES: hypothetical protein [unclassified Methanoculleus]|jgi:hypothetical protein|uniref:hypothetical protein n=1 Tax=unclassified Methanoculleus TaxID=2619537 RepID=UPI00319E7835